MGVYNVDKLDGSLSLIAGRGQITQYSTVPTATVDRLNEIIQYVGTTTSSYTNGYFYKCIYDESVTPAVYRWNNIQVQTGGGTGTDNVVEGYFNPANNLFYEESTYITPIIGASNTLYVSLDTNLLYRYANSIFIRVDDVTVDSDIVEGYYNTTDGKFYEESTYTTEITGETGKIYISLDTNVQYRYNGSNYVTIGGSIPVASSSVLGGVKVGTDLDIDANGVLTTNLGLVVSSNKLCVRYSVDEP